jgi:hypothetical protein
VVNSSVVVGVTWKQKGEHVRDNFIEDCALPLLVWMFSSPLVQPRKEVLANRRIYILQESLHLSLILGEVEREHVLVVIGTNWGRSIRRNPYDNFVCGGIFENVVHRRGEVAEEQLDTFKPGLVIGFALLS